MNTARAFTPGSSPDEGPKDYVAFAARFALLSGLDLRQYKPRQMDRRLRAFAADQGYDDLLAFERHLRTDAQMVRDLLDHITINVSQIWRNATQWDALRQEIVPELLRQHGPFRAWSAGCSYGAEAYSLAMILAEQRALGRSQILGTDIDEVMLRRGRAGEFSAADARTAPDDLIRRWFDAQADGSIRAQEALRKVTSFQKGDLLAPGRDRTFDLILCRNVLIYFNDEACAKVHARLAAALRPGGYMMIGSTERIRQPLADLGLRLVRPFVFQKTEAEG